MDHSHLIAAAHRFGVPADTLRLVVAPYRVCPLGAHIDHQLGPVTALAIDRGVVFAYAPTADGRVRLGSLDFPGTVEFALNDVPAKRDGDWGNFARGAVLALQRHHRLIQGVVGVTAGSISGGGLSSSAAVGVVLPAGRRSGERAGMSAKARARTSGLTRLSRTTTWLRQRRPRPAGHPLRAPRHLATFTCATLDHELIPTAAAMPPFRILSLLRHPQGAFRRHRLQPPGRRMHGGGDDLLQAAGHRRAGEARPADRRRVRDPLHQLAGSAAKRAAHFPLFSEPRRQATPRRRSLVRGRHHRIRPADDRIGDEARSTTTSAARHRSSTCTVYSSRPTACTVPGSAGPGSGRRCAAFVADAEARGRAGPA
ncbi:MAG: galactokinase family protein [Gemmataceae bacterium]